MEKYIIIRISKIDIKKHKIAETWITSAFKETNGVNYMENKGIAQTRKFSEYITKFLANQIS